MDPTKFVVGEVEVEPKYDKVHAHLFVDALWSPAGKGLTSWLSFVMSNCDVVTFPLVSWVRCGA